jgi:hypothetical protein
MLTVVAKQTCQCCTVAMQFRSLASAKAAFTAAGLTECAAITDDAGETHGFVDTFGNEELVDEQGVATHCHVRMAA